MDRLNTLNIVCDGGLNVTADLLNQGSNLIGTARQLINYEPAESQGYRKVSGYLKYDTDTVPGDTNSPILGVKPALSGVFAARIDTSSGTDNAIHYSTGSGWTKINSAARGGSVDHVRFVVYNLVQETVIITDGVNPALKYDGSSDTLLNGTGAPTNPKYATLHLSRLILSGYGNQSRVTISAPNDDEDFTSASGAIEINVGDTVVGLKSFRDTLYIFCKNSIKKLEGSSSSDFIMRDVTDDIGCISGDTIQEIAGDLLFLAPDGLRSLAATERIGDVELGIQSSEIDPLVSAVLNDGTARYSSIIIPSKSQYRLFYWRAGFDDESQRGFLGRVKPTQTNQQYQWAELVGFPVYCCGFRIINDVESVVFGHPTNGYVYRFEQGGSFDGTAIPFVYRTPPLVFDDINLRKVIHRIRITIRTEQDTAISVKAILDEYYQESIQPSAKTINVDGDGVSFGASAALFSSAEFAGNATPYVLSKRLEGSGYTITIEITGSGVNLSHQIDDIILEYMMKGRR